MIGSSVVDDIKVKYEMVEATDKYLIVKFYIQANILSIAFTCFGDF